MHYRIFDVLLSLSLLSLEYYKLAESSYSKVEFEHFERRLKKKKKKVSVIDLDLQRTSWRMLAMTYGLAILAGILIAASTLAFRQIATLHSGTSGIFVISIRNINK